MSIRRKTAPLLVLLALATCPPVAGTAQELPRESEGADARNVILMIADGAGIGAWTAARLATSGPAGAGLAVGSMPVLGLVETASDSHRVTDSAAGATVYATGERVTNRTIGVGPGCPMPRRVRREAGDWPAGCEPSRTWFQIADDRGKATGVVTTAAVVDATPASFVAHSPSRYWADAIAEQYARAELDVLLGGGYRYFAPDPRGVGADLLGPMCDVSHCVFTAEELAAYRPGPRPLVGLFSPGDMDDLDRRPVGLPEMVAAALVRLARDPDGFVAIFETEATDNAGHANASLERLTADILEFDQAVGVALEFARRTPGTLVIVTADHETGGLSLVADGDGFRADYSTEGHTAALVPLFAEGPGAERFSGLRANFEVGRALMDIARSW